MAVRLGRLRGSSKEATEAPLKGDSPAERVTLRLREHGPLVAVLCLSAFLNFWNLSANGYGNAYYAAAVRSMTESWHNFFFASFDPGGFITVDKPPAGLWVQAASAKVFGFSGTSLLLPEALAGVASVLVLYLAVSRVFGRMPGLVAALVLAVTPMSVAINRSNNLDAWLALCTTVAAYCVVRALEKGNWRWLVLSGVMIGVAFNTKTLAGFVAAPALFAAYLATAPVSLRLRLTHCMLAGVVLLAVSAS
jgi:4-amino-4-deoxy-L-arabinose transferase-like glycosyltransferase